MTEEQDRAEILRNYRAQLQAMVARLVGRIVTEATVYGARAKWRLQFAMEFTRLNGTWFASRSEATTW